MEAFVPIRLPLSDSDSLISSPAQLGDGMKLKIAIIGPKVHNVGYRYFLMNNAMSRRIRMFEAHNIEGETEQEVEVLIDSDEGKVATFKELARTKWPKRAEVSSVSFEDFDGDVMRIGEYAQFCTTIQMDKAIPVLLDIRDDTKAMKEDIGSMKGDMRSVKEDIGSMKGDLKCVRDNTASLIKGQNDTIGEFRDLREDLARRDSGERLARMEKDVRTIKSKLSIR